MLNRHAKFATILQEADALKERAMFQHMKNKLYKWEYKYGRYAIHNLMLVIIAGQALVYLADLFTMGISIQNMLSLNFPMILRGQVWRLVTFIFVPLNNTPLLVFLYLYFDYLIGHSVEMRWGDFKFNLYYLVGMLTAILGAALTGYGTASYLHLTFFFLFAQMYPDMQMLLFFIIPIKAKYISIFSAVVCLIDFFRGGWSTRMAILMAVLTYLIFFGSDLFTTIQQEIKYSKARRNWNQNNRR